MFTRTGSDVFVTVQCGDEDVGKGLVEDGLLLVDKKGGRKFAKMLKDYEDAMQKAKKHHLNIWRYGDITEDDAKAGINILLKLVLNTFRVQYRCTKYITRNLSNFLQNIDPCIQEFGVGVKPAR